MVGPTVWAWRTVSSWTYTFYLWLIQGFVAFFVVVVGVIDSLFQAAGVVIAAFGLGQMMAADERQPRLAIVPIVTPGGAALAASYRF